MVSGVSSLPVPCLGSAVGFRHSDGSYHGRPCQRRGALDVVYGFTVPASELAKMAVVIAVSFILSKKQDDEGANPKAFKYILIITGIVCLLIAPENLSTAMLLFGVVFLMMFIGRVAARKLLMLVGSLGLVGAVGVVFLLAIPKDSDIPFLHRFDTWKSRIVNFTEKEEVPAAKFDIDKDAQIAHARIAIARVMS